MTQREGLSLDVVCGFERADREAQIERVRCGRPGIAGGDVGHDRRQHLGPATIAAASDQCGGKTVTHVRQPIKAIIERAGVEEQVAAQTRRADLPQMAGMVIEQQTGHNMLVRNLASRNKGA